MAAENGYADCVALLAAASADVNAHYDTEPEPELWGSSVPIAFFPCFFGHVEVKRSADARTGF